MISHSPIKELITIRLAGGHSRNSAWQVPTLPCVFLLWWTKILRRTTEFDFASLSHKPSRFLSRSLSSRSSSGKRIIIQLNSQSSPCPSAWVEGQGRRWNKKEYVGFSIMPTVMFWRRVGLYVLPSCCHMDSPLHHCTLFQWWPRRMTSGKTWTVSARTRWHSRLRKPPGFAPGNRNTEWATDLGRCTGRFADGM